MNEKHTTTTEKYIAKEIEQSLRRHGVSQNSRIKTDVQARVTVVWSHSDPAVRVCDDNGRLLSVDQYLANLRRDPKYASSFPAEPPRISADDQAGLYREFTKV